MSTVKICPKCKQTRPTTDYYRNRTTSDGLGSYCKSCAKSSVVRANIKRLCNNELSNDDIDRLREISKCQICDLDISGKNHHIDHNHLDNSARGALCTSCNTRVGHYEQGHTITDLDILNKIVNYLNEYSKDI